MKHDKRWTDDRLQRLRELAVTMRYAHLIAVAMDVTQHSVVMVANREKIDVIRRSPEQSADVEANRRARELRKYTNLKVNNKSTSRVVAVSRTSAAFRNMLPRIPDDISKLRLREMLAEAFRNTAGVSV